MPVTIDLGVLSRFSADIEAELADPSASGPVRDAIFAWGEFYRSWAKLRFSKQSRGGGEWPPLSPATIRGRRKGKGKKLKVKRRGGKTEEMSVGQGTVRILYDTGTLIGALDPKLNVESGGVQENIPFGITVGYGGSSKHEKFPNTIAGLAAIHQAGNEKLPARPIIVTPPDDANCIRKMSRALADAITQEWRKRAG